MLSKEEIEKAKEDFNFCNEGDYITKEMSDSKNVLLNYIDKLESDKQKLIEKLEEDIDELETLNDNYTDADIFEGIYTTRGQIIKTREILSILKEKKQVTVK